MKAPRRVPQYQRLQTLIDVLLSEGLSYSAPVAGSYRSPVEMRDLSGDGQEEAVVFLRGATDTQLVVFVPTGDSYTPLQRITENADSVHSIAFHDFTGDGKTEIAVGWQLGNLRSVSVYTLIGDTPTEILSQPYEEYVVYDEENGDLPALFIVKLDAAELTGIASLFIYRDGEMPLLDSDNLSLGAEAVLRVRTTPLTDGKPGFLVASKFQTTGEITDVFTYRDDSLINVSRNMETGISSALVRSMSVIADDIDEDGVVDLPLPIMLQPHPEAAEDAAIVYEMYWRAYDSNGASIETARTFYNEYRGWYLLLPEQWPDTGDYTVKRNAISTSRVITTFSLLLEDNATYDFLSIDYFNHAAGNKPQFQNRTVLLDETLLSVTAELTPFPKDFAQYSITEEELKSMFHVIPVQWEGGV